MKDKTKDKAKEQRLWLWAMLLSSSIGISIWYIRGLSSVPVNEWLSQTMVTFSYFTNLTNALVIVMTASLLIGRGRLANWIKSPSVQSAICLYIAFVGLAYWTLLSGNAEFKTALDWIPQLTAHTLSPILGAVYWFRAVSRGQLSWRDPVIWLIYPIVYLIYWLFRGPLVGYYPYFFIDVDTLGYGGVTLWSGMLIFVFLVLGSLMVLVDHRQAKSRDAASG